MRIYKNFTIVIFSIHKFKNSLLFIKWKLTYHILGVKLKSNYRTTNLIKTIICYESYDGICEPFYVCPGVTFKINNFCKQYIKKIKGFLRI